MGEMMKTTRTPALALILAVCGSCASNAQVAKAVYPIEYISETGSSPRPILGFYGDHFYQSFEGVPPAERHQSEMRGSMKVTITGGRVETDYLPLVVPGLGETARLGDFSCTSSAGSEILVDCSGSKSGRRYRASFSETRGFLWFESVCYPDTSKTCRYVPYSSELVFSPAMIATLSR